MLEEVRESLNPILLRRFKATELLESERRYKFSCSYKASNINHTTRSSVVKTNLSVVRARPVSSKTRISYYHPTSYRKSVMVVQPLHRGSKMDIRSSFINRLQLLPVVKT